MRSIPPSTDPGKPTATPAALIGSLLVLASLATTGVALWLIWVTAVVLPTRDPAHIPLWRAVAACFLAYGALSGACVAAGRGHPPIRWAMGATSVVAIVLGLYGIADAIRRAGPGGDFEGYILLLGFTLGGHGIIGLLHTLRTRGAARPPTTA
jgi:hypothetical protein